MYLWCALPLPPDLPVQSSFLELFKSKPLKGKIAQGKLWIPTFIMKFSLESVLLNSSKNKLWTGRSGGRSRAHHKYTLNSEHSFKTQCFHGSQGYSIYSFAQLSWHNTSENKFWMVDLGFLLFSSPFPFIVFFLVACNCELWMVTSWYPSFFIACFFQSFFSKTGICKF